MVKVKKGNIGICQTFAENDDIGETLVIPRKVVRSIKVIDTFKS